MSYYYRFELNGRGIESFLAWGVAPRGWLGEVCGDLSETIEKLRPEEAGLTFLTELGLWLYLDSGLMEWHRSQLGRPLLVQRLDLPKFCSPVAAYKARITPAQIKEGTSRKLSWEQFASEYPQVPLIDKVVLLFVDDRAGDARVLVMDCPAKHGTGTALEVPAGSVDEGETLVEAAIREATEETGLNNIRCLKKIDEYLIYRFTHGQFNRRHVFLMTADYPEVETWSHIVTGSGNDRGRRFDFHWLSWQEAEQELAETLGYSLVRALSESTRKGPAFVTKSP